MPGAGARAERESARAAPLDAAARPGQANPGARLLFLSPAGREIQTSSPSHLSPPLHPFTSTQSTPPPTPTQTPTS